MVDDRLSAEESRLWHAWRVAGENVLARVARDIADGTTLSGSDYAVLSRLQDLGRGELRQQDLAASLRWDKSRLSHQLSRMQRRKLVRRRPGPGRGVAVVLLAEGARQLAAARPIHTGAVRRHLVARLDPGQRQALLALCALLEDSEWDADERGAREAWAQEQRQG